MTAETSTIPLSSQKIAPSSSYRSLTGRFDALTKERVLPVFVRMARALASAPALTPRHLRVLEYLVLKLFVCRPAGTHIRKPIPPHEFESLLRLIGRSADPDAADQGVQRYLELTEEALTLRNGEEGEILKLLSRIRSVKYQIGPAYLDEEVLKAVVGCFLILERVTKEAGFTSDTAKARRMVADLRIEPPINSDLAVIVDASDATVMLPAVRPEKNSLPTASETAVSPSMARAEDAPCLTGAAPTASPELGASSVSGIGSSAATPVITTGAMAAPMVSSDLRSTGSFPAAGATPASMISPDLRSTGSFRLPIPLGPEVGRHPSVSAAVHVPVPNAAPTARASIEGPASRSRQATTAHRTSSLPVVAPAASMVPGVSESAHDIVLAQVARAIQRPALTSTLPDLVRQPSWKRMMLFLTMLYTAAAACLELDRWHDQAPPTASSLHDVHPFRIRGTVAETYIQTAVLERGQLLLTPKDAWRMLSAEEQSQLTSHITTALVGRSAIRSVQFLDGLPNRPQAPSDVEDTSSIAR